jgi:hypothetical protein
VRVALAASLVLAATAVGVVLSRAPLTVVGTNSIPTPASEYVKGASSRCQFGGTLPQGTSAIRISAGSNLGPRVTLKVLSGAQVVTEGERDPGWGTDQTVTVPVRRVPRTIPNANVCIAFGPTIEVIHINGTLRFLSVTPRIEYLRPGRASWWSLASSIAGRMGRGHAPGGSWIVFLLLALMITVATLASRLILRELGPSRRPAAEAGQILRRIPSVLRRIPRAAWICALIACLNAACWSVITPPFQVPDEPAHFAYVQQLAETGTLPIPGKLGYSEEEEVALRDLHQLKVRFYPENHPVATAAEQRRLQHDLASPFLRRVGPGGAGVAAGHPPLYYALQTIPYALGSGGTLLDRLELMRLLSALMAGVTALFAYLFVREALPRVAWAWAVGGLGVALSPLLGFMSGAVNPDAMFYAVSAAIFYLLARAFRRGLTPRLAIAIGVVTGIGLLTKSNFIGLVPGIIVGLIVLGLLEARASRRTAYRSLALALAIPALPVCVYIFANLLSNRPTLGSLSGAIHTGSGQGSVLGDIEFIWQAYLPRLPGMATDFPGILPPRGIWFDRSIGLYGWLDTPFPLWVDDVALIPAALLAILGIRELIARANRLRSRLVELAVYAVIAAGLLILIGATSYGEFPGMAFTGFAEPRYLLPLLPLVGAWLVLSARGAGRRWGPAAGTLIVVLFLAHDVFSQLQVLARYYG